MYCNTCKIKVVGKACHCPLCGQKVDLTETTEIHLESVANTHTAISTETVTNAVNINVVESNKPLENQQVCENQNGQQDSENQQLLYPMPKVRWKVLDKFSRFYLAFTTVVIAICLTVNIVHNDEFMWSIVVMVCLVYIFYLVRFTLIAQGRFNAQIFGQAIALTAVFVAVRFIFGGNDWIFIAWLPIVYFISTLLILVYIGVEWRDLRKKLMSLITMAILGIVPICNAYLLDLSVKWPSIAVSSFSAIVIIVAIIVGRKLLLGELKRFFHL